MTDGETLRLLRTIKGMKQEFLARKLGISQPAYSKLEKCAYIKDKKLQEVLRALGCTAEDLDRVHGIFKTSV